MANLSNIIPDSNNNGKFDMDDLLDAIAKSSPLLIMITASIAFLLLIVFESDYYTHILGTRWSSPAAIAGGIAVAFVRELSRAVLLIMTFADFRKSNAKGAWLGLLMSLSLVAYDGFSSGPISSLWTDSHSQSLGAIVADLIVFLVSLSFFLEFRLVLSGKSNRRAPAPTPSQTANPVQPQTNDDTVNISPAIMLSIGNGYKISSDQIEEVRQAIKNSEPERDILELINSYSEINRYRDNQNKPKKTRQNGTPAEEGVGIPLDLSGESN